MPENPNQNPNPNSVQTDPMTVAGQIASSGVAGTSAFGVSVQKQSLNDLIALDRYQREKASADVGIFELQTQPGSTRY